MVEVYKPTQFMATTLNSKGELLIFNTFSGQLYKALPEYANRVTNILKEDSIQESDVDFPKLIEAGFLVTVNADEHAFLKAQTERFLSAPILDVMILPTHQCNCRCVYCYEDFKNGIMSERVQHNLFEFIKVRLRDCTSLHVEWFGGEPLVALDVVRRLSLRFIELCNIQRKSYTAAMTTNGTLLTLDTFRELQRYKVLSYQITLDGTKLTHDRQRPLSGGGSSYNMIVGNLHMIKTNVKSKSFLVLLRINITKSIIDQFETYLCNLENLLQNDSRFHISYNIVADWGGDRIDGFRDELIQRDEEIIGILNEKIVNSKTGIGIKNVVTGLGGSINFNPGCHVDRHNSYTIDSSGAISKCAQEIRTDHVPLGDLSDINWGLNQYEVARWMSPAQYEIPEKCRPCHMLPTGCYRAYSCVVHRFEHKYIDSAPPQELKCPVAKSNLPTLICEMDLAGKSISLTENEKGVA